MTSAQVKSFFSFFLSTILFILLVLANFYKEYVYTYIPFLPEYTIPVFSGIVVLIIMLTFWFRESADEKLRYEFFTIVTHKFNTPLTGLRWAIQMLHKELTFQEKEDLLKQMEGANERLMEIVSLLVGFVKFDRRLEYAYEAASVREMIDESLQKYGGQIRQKNISFEINSSQAIPTIIIDKRKIQFVIDMLLDNAVKYTPSGGKIKVEVIQQRKSILLSVADTGIGIKMLDMRKLFKRFYRSEDAKKVDTEGMGLGLYTIKRIVEHHNGRIWAKSGGKGKGSTFYLELKMK
jgi:signal transduction histidine kinase